ncbi:arsenate reductase [Salinihabitans flavidus]|uniref:Arsenate reductase n=1 Tax=Salinihabitans flavidus TaxID=569882 RepID=A0A1H8MLV0_9RHOB|nr:arsenate reductase (glutaredoxin) [Salinihabitans flavidus]SEO18411.1 arsenate reductase [Salinihabitans flavidus]
MIDYWHNPRCSKSRAGLALLHERGAQVALRLYLKQPPTLAELRAVTSALALPAIAMMRTGEATFRDLGLSADSDEETLLTAMAAHPILIERPIGIRGSTAVIGRPPEALLDLL